MTDRLNPYLGAPGKTNCRGLEDVLMTVFVSSCINCRNVPNNVFQYNYHQVYSSYVVLINTKSKARSS